MARSARNPHTASEPEPDTRGIVLMDETHQGTRPHRSRAEMQAAALQVFEQHVHIMCGRDGLPYERMVIGTNIEVADRRASFQRLSNAIEAVSEKLTSAEYLELCNAALGVHPKPN
jgi:hypothetical protein